MSRWARPRFADPRSATPLSPVVFIVASSLILFTVSASSPRSVASADADLTENVNLLRVTPAFADSTAAAGISVTQVAHIPGQAWADCNGDGWLDLYLTGGREANVLYESNGDGTFSLSPHWEDVDMPDSKSGGAVFADYNNDGRPDLYVLVDSNTAGSGPNRLFRNDGPSGFTDVTTEAGVGDMGLGTTGSWADFDDDGDLDLYVANWDCNLCPNTRRDGLYRNEGDGTFADISDALGPEAYGIGFVASWLDYDNDGDLDIYCVNDKNYAGTGVYPHRNVLWRNDGAGCTHWCFTDVSEDAGADIAVDGMGLAIGDYDHDGDLDMYFSNAGPQVFLENQTSQGNPVFEDVSADIQVDFDGIGWGTVFIDYDNDGWSDLYLATMHPQPELANRLFWNDGQLPNPTYVDVTETSGAADTGKTFGVAYADYDADGWMDLVIGNLDDLPGEGYALYRNVSYTQSTNGWVRFRLSGGGPVNRDAIGSRIYLTSTDGETQMAEVKCGSSLGAGNDVALHFGLGSASVTEVEVVWPDGVSQSFGDVSINEEWQIVYPGVIDVVDLSVGTPDGVVLHAARPNPANQAAAIGFTLPERTLVSLKIYDAGGRAVRSLVDDELAARRHSVIWDGRDASGQVVSSGIYFYRLQAGPIKRSGKMVLTR